jgi:hypothetical protein
LQTLLKKIKNKKVVKELKVPKDKMASEINSENLRTTTNSTEVLMLILQFKAGDLDSMIEIKSQALEIEGVKLLLIGLAELKI